jgi:hypothetical protein
MPRIPEGLLDSIIFLYQSEEDAASGAPGQLTEDRPAGGTGFLVQDPEEPRCIFVVTCQHVIAHGATVIRANLADSTRTISGAREDWIPHPAGDDLAVRVLLRDEELASLGLPFDILLWPTWREWEPERSRVFGPGRKFSSSVASFITKAVSGTCPRFASGTSLRCLGRLSIHPGELARRRSWLRHDRTADTAARRSS